MNDYFEDSRPILISLKRIFTHIFLPRGEVFLQQQINLDSDNTDSEAKSFKVHGGQSAFKWDGLAFRGLSLSPSNCDSWH